MKRKSWQIALMGFFAVQCLNVAALSTDSNTPTSNSTPYDNSYEKPSQLGESNPTLASSNNEKKYEAKDFSYLLGMPGFSDQALNMHFTLYKGYVKNANLLLEKIRELSTTGQQKSVEFAELKRRLGWEWDGMRLHELYFENLGGKAPIANQSDIYKKIQQSFGNYDHWKEDFIGTGLMRGIGWSVLYYDPLTDSMINTWINEHDVGHLAGGQPILIMDVFEHAYLPDYQLDRAKYIDAFFKNINWDVVNKRYENALNSSSYSKTPSSLRGGGYGQ